MMRGAKIVALKELRDSLRDRRTIINSLAMGPILGPLIFIGMLTLITQKEVEKAVETLHIPVVNQSLAPNLIGFLEQQGVVVEPAPSDPEQAIRNEDHAVVIRITEQYPEQWRSGKPAVVEVIADSSKREISTTLTRVRLLLNGYSGQIGSQRIQLRGVDPRLVRAVQVRDIDLSTPASRGALILAMLPYFIMITLFVSSTAIAVDTTAGEKERQSLEPLLINPLPRWQIMAGKLAATTLFSLVALALTLIAFMVFVGFIPSSRLDFELNINPVLAMRFWYITAPVGLVAAALLTTISAASKSLREAQSYMGMVILIPMLPSLWLFINPVKAETWMMWIPLLSQNVLVNQLIRGDPVLMIWELISILSTLALGIILALTAARFYQKPKLLFTG